MIAQTPFLESFQAMAHGEGIGTEPILIWEEWAESSQRQAGKNDFTEQSSEVEIDIQKSAKDTYPYMWEKYMRPGKGLEQKISLNSANALDSQGLFTSPSNENLMIYKELGWEGRRTHIFWVVRNNYS